MDTVPFNDMTFREATSPKGLGDSVISCRMVMTMRGISHPVLMRALAGIDKKHWSEFILALAERGAHLSFFPESVNTEVRHRAHETAQPIVSGSVTDVAKPASRSQSGVQAVSTDERMDPEELRMMLGFGDTRP